MFLRHWFIRFLTPVIWRVSKKRKLRAIQEFALTELDSAWQSLYAMDFVVSPQVRAMLFQHALEERGHHEIFQSLGLSESGAPLPQPVFKRKALWRPGAKRAVLDFFSYIHAGESEVNRDFVVYSGARIDEAIRGVFLKIKEEEEKHEHEFVSTVLPLLGGSQGALRRTVFHFRLKRAYAGYVKAVEKVGLIPLSLILQTLYLLGGILAVPALRRRLGLSRRDQREISRSQAAYVRATITATAARSP